MAIINDEAGLINFMEEAEEISEDRPIFNRLFLWIVHRSRC